VDFHLRRPGFWRRADRVIAISAAVRRILVEDGIDPANIVVVNSGIDLSSTERIRQASIRLELGLSAAGPLAVAVGALVDHKDHQTLIRAAARLRTTHPDLQWAVAGEGDLRVALEREIRDLGLGSVIHLLGQVTEPLRLIRDASVFVMSSKEEGLGTSVLDAMAIGTPVVATRAGGIPEMVDGGAGILVPPRDPDLLAAGVAQVLDHPDLAARLVETASKRVATFSAGGMAEGVLQVYRSIVIER
jgi:glycosyltransferase involved in cell wall biosynthesis